METIVVGVDGSPTSMRALSVAGGLARDLESHLTVVFARFVYLALPEHVAEDMFVDVLDGVERFVREAVSEQLGDLAVRWSFEAHTGHPEQVICDVATRVDARMVVVGRSGWSTIHEVLLGSVSNRLAHRPEWPVLLVS